MKRLATTSLIALAGTFGAAAPAFAHLPPGAYGSLAAGLSHPLFGLDHLLAMVAVGLWASQMGPRALWAVPSAFVAVMVAGFSLALAGIPLIMVEPMILVSIIVLGAMVAMAVKLDIRLGAAVVGAFALFHGHAHGGELGAAGALEFGLGFAVSTAVLHGAGLAIGLLANRINAGGKLGMAVARGIGAAMAVTGIALAVA